MAKKQVKNNDKKYFIIIVSTIIAFLFISNIYFIYNYCKAKEEQIETQEVLFTKTDEKFDKEKKYYAKIKYKKFKSLYNGSKVNTIAIVDNSSNTHDKFIEMINKTAYYKHTKMYLLETSKLSKKDEIAFLDLDERLKELESNYIIVVSGKKILSIQTFDNEQLNKIIEGLGD